MYLFWQYQTPFRTWLQQFEQMLNDKTVFDCLGLDEFFDWRNVTEQQALSQQLQLVDAKHLKLEVTTV